MLLHLFQPGKVNIREPRAVRHPKLRRSALERPIHQRGHGIVGQRALFIGLFRNKIEVLKHRVVQGVEKQKVLTLGNEVLPELFGQKHV